MKTQLFKIYGMQQTQFWEGSSYFPLSQEKRKFSNNLTFHLKELEMEQKPKSTEERKWDKKNREDETKNQFQELKIFLKETKLINLLPD